MWCPHVHVCKFEKATAQIRVHVHWHTIIPRVSVSKTHVLWLKVVAPINKEEWADVFPCLQVRVPKIHQLTSTCLLSEDDPELEVEDLTQWLPGVVVCCAWPGWNRHLRRFVALALTNVEDTSWGNTPWRKMNRCMTEKDVQTTNPQRVVFSCDVPMQARFAYKGHEWSQFLDNLLRVFFFCWNYFMFQ